MGANEQQIQFWNEQAGPRWVAFQEQFDEQLEPIGVAAMDRLGVPAGARVIDVGCGCGATSFDLARRVGPSGRVLGVDISGPMLDHARSRLARLQVGNVELVRGDAQVAELPESDLVFSRFGVMFFEDPVAAFRNLRGALAPAGRVGFVCWRPIDENPFMYVAARAAAEHIELPPSPPADQPGPFAFADPARPRRILADAGFSSIDVSAVDVQIELTRDLDETIDFLLHVGPAATALRAADPAKAAPIAATLREALQPFVTPRGVAMGAAVWVVTASR